MQTIEGKQYICDYIGRDSDLTITDVEGIADYAFSFLPNIRSITIGNGVKSIGEWAFDECISLTDISIPNSVTEIGRCALGHCKSLKDINIPNSVTSLGIGVFSHCTGLSSFVIPNSLTNISNSAFFGCTNLEEIQIHNNITSIGEGAFGGCTNLKSIYIPKEVDNIGTNAFINCTALTSVTVKNPTPVSISLYTFSNSGNAILYVPANSSEEYKKAEFWKEFKEIIEIPNTIMGITDGTEYTQEISTDIEQLTYTRTFSNTHWQALYVPFSIPVDSLSKNGVQVAELNDTHQWDFNGDGVADSTRVEFFTLTSGSTEANYPYLIRATEPTTLSLTLKGIEVRAAEENSIECSSTKQKFTFVGTYTGVSGADMYDNNYYGMSGGGLKRVSSTSVSLKPQRWYMKIENKNGSPVNYFAPSIRFTVDGIDEEEEETSAIVDMCTESRNRHKAFYSLEGIRQHTAPTQRGMYVRQDKKLIIR